MIIRDTIKPKSLAAKVKEEEIVEVSSKKEKKIESKDESQEKQTEHKVKEDKK